MGVSDEQLGARGKPATGPPATALFCADVGVELVLPSRCGSVARPWT